MANTILVLGFKTPNKMEMGSPVYFGKDADAAEKSLQDSQFYRHEFFQLSVAYKRKFNDKFKNSASAAAPEGEPEADSEAGAPTGGTDQGKTKGKGRKGKETPGTELL